MAESNIFDPSFEELPAILPVFPLAGLLLLPGNPLPLNIFEPRYLAMVKASLAYPRLIGLIQPCSSKRASNTRIFAAGEEHLYMVGCAGRITNFAETDDGRYLITVRGLCRFQIIQEQSPQNGYRLMKVDFLPYKRDLTKSAEVIRTEEVEGLFQALKPYFKHHKVTADWDLLRKAEIEKLVNSLSTLGDFEESEKQALLETATIRERLHLLKCLMEIACFPKNFSRGKN